MKTQAKKPFFFSALIIAVLMFSAAFTGCKKDDTVVASKFSGSIEEDAAESISGAMGDDNGGTTDNMADMYSLASPSGISNANTLGKIEGVTIIDSTYDANTGWWTMNLKREKITNLTSFSFSRSYKFQYLKDVNNTSSFQKYRVVPRLGGSDTATAIKFEIVSGTGSFKTPRLAHKLTKLSGAFLGTGLNTDTVSVTLTASYVREGSDSITTRNSARMIVHVFTIKQLQAKGPRFKTLTHRTQFASAYSGSASGTYSATVNFVKGDQYGEKIILKDFTITFGGGKGSISINGKTFKNKMKEGEMDDTP